MIVELRGVGYENQGAALMLAAVAEHFAAMDGRVDLASQPLRNAGSAPFASPELARKLPLPRVSRTAIATAFMSRWFRTAYRLVREREIDAVLDASGFAFGDQWGVGPSEQMAFEVARWKRQRKKVVLLPQAFGPFSIGSIRSAFSRVVRQADLVFARDRQSHNHLVDLGAPAGSLRIAPDFTNLVTGAVPSSFRQRPRRAAIVPNLRMTDMTVPEQSAKYMPFLAQCVRELRKREVDPFIVVHSAGDEELVPQIQDALGVELEIIRQRNPLYTKGILGTCLVAIASRYHALASCLAQGVPCIGTGWSHKYRLLFEDYECPECLLPVDASVEQIGASLDGVLEEPNRSKLIEGLRCAGLRQAEQVRTMWAEIDTLLGLRSG